MSDWFSRNWQTGAPQNSSLSPHSHSVLPVCSLIYLRAKNMHWSVIEAIIGSNCQRLGSSPTSTPPTPMLYYKPSFFRHFGYFHRLFLMSILFCLSIQYISNLLPFAWRSSHQTGYCFYQLNAKIQILKLPERFQVLQWRIKAKQH